MALHFFGLENLKNLDEGRISVAFGQALKRAILDCEDRPGEEAPRVVSLQVQLKPERDESGHCTSVWGNFQIHDKIPTRKSKPYNFGLKAGGRMFYNDQDPGNVRQMGFEDVGEDGRARQEWAGEDNADEE